MTDDSKKPDVQSAQKRKPHQFQPGNKAGVGHGRPKRVAAMQEAIDEAGTPDRLRAIMAGLHEIATNADADTDRVAASKVLLDRIIGRPREQPILTPPVVMPEVVTMADVAEGRKRVWQAINSGAIDIEQAKPYFEQLDRDRVVIEGAGFAAQIEAMRAEIAAMRERA